MKIRSTSDAILIMKGPARTKNGTRIPWPDNAVRFWESQLYENASHYWVHGLRFTLADAVQYIYISNKIQNYDDALQQFDAFRRMNYPVPGGPWFGENFNFLVQPWIVDKWTLAQMTAWQLT